MGFATESGIEMISREREKQMAINGFDAAHDDKHVKGELAQVAAYYAHPGYCDQAGQAFAVDFPVTWTPRWNKKGKQSRIRDLAIAGALIAAEIDRLRRMG